MAGQVAICKAGICKYPAHCTDSCCIQHLIDTPYERFRSIFKPIVAGGTTGVVTGPTGNMGGSGTFTISDAAIVQRQDGSFHIAPHVEKPPVPAPKTHDTEFDQLKAGVAKSWKVYRLY